MTSMDGGDGISTTKRTLRVLFVGTASRECRDLLAREEAEVWCGTIWYNIGFLIAGYQACMGKQCAVLV